MNRRWNHMCRTSPNKNVHVRNDCEAFAHISLQGLLLLLQLLRSTFSFFFFFFFCSTTKNLPPSQQREEPQVPPAHIPCSAALWLGTGLGGRRLTRVITGCLWPTESSWGPLRCEFVHLWECGPCCAANGPYPRCPSPPRLPPWSAGLLLLWCQISSAAHSSGDSPPAHEGWGWERKPKRKKTCDVWKVIAVWLQLTYISHHRHCSRVQWCNTMVCWKHYGTINKEPVASFGLSKVYLVPLVPSFHCNSQVLFLNRNLMSSRVETNQTSDFKHGSIKSNALQKCPCDWKSV